MGSRYNIFAFGAAAMFTLLLQIGALEDYFVYVVVGPSVLGGCVMLCACAYAVWHTLHYQLLVPWLDKRKRKGIQRSRK